MNIKFIFFISFLAYMMSSCSTEIIEYYNSQEESEPDNEQGGTDPDSPLPKPIEYFKFNTNVITDLTVEELNGVYSFETTGGDPNIQLMPLMEVNEADSVVLTFDYIAPSGIKELEIFYSLFDPSSGTFNVVGGRSEIVGDLPSTTSWQNISFNLYNSINDFGWGIVGDFLRLDFGRESGISFKIKNMYLRSMTDKEKEDINKEPVSVVDFSIDIERSKVNGVELSEEAGVYTIKTTNADPYIYTNTLTEECSDEAVILTFDYVAPKGVSLFQLLLSPEAPDRFTNLPDIEASQDWRTYSVNLQELFDAPAYSTWGRKGDFIRFDLGSLPDVEIKIRDIRLSSSEQE